MEVLNHYIIIIIPSLTMSRLMLIIVHYCRVRWSQPCKVNSFCSFPNHEDFVALEVIPYCIKIWNSWYYFIFIFSVLFKLICLLFINFALRSLLLLWSLLMVEQILLAFILNHIYLYYYRKFLAYNNILLLWVIYTTF